MTLLFWCKAVLWIVACTRKVVAVLIILNNLFSFRISVWISFDYRVIENSLQANIEGPLGSFNIRGLKSTDSPGSSIPTKSTLKWLLIYLISSFPAACEIRIQNRMSTKQPVKWMLRFPHETWKQNMECLQPVCLMLIVEGKLYTFEVASWLENSNIHLTFLAMIAGRLQSFTGSIFPIYVHSYVIQWLLLDREEMHKIILTGDWQCKWQEIGYLEFLVFCNIINLKN